MTIVNIALFAFSDGLNFIRSFTMLKGEVIPHLVRKQFSKETKKQTEKELPNADASVISLATCKPSKNQ